LERIAGLYPLFIAVTLLTARELEVGVEQRVMVGKRRWPIIDGRAPLFTFEHCSPTVKSEAITGGFFGSREVLRLGA
jgi:hypothetical protein